MTSEWYALAVQPRKEHFVENQLNSNGFRAAYPRFKKIVRHARQTKTVLAPLFPGYVFINLDLSRQSWRKANWMQGSIGLVRFDNRPAPLPKTFIDNFVLGLGEGSIAEFKQNLKIGDNVRAIGGPFDSFQGEIIALSDHDRVKVLMDALNRKIETTLPKNQIIVAA